MKEVNFGKGRDVGKVLRASILVSDVGWYHRARIKASYRAGVLCVNTIEINNQSEYKEFRALVDEDLTIQRLWVDCNMAWETMISRLRVALANSKADVICVPGWSANYSLAAICWSRENGKRLVMMSESQAEDHVRNRLREAVKSRIVHACDAALVGGEPHRDYVVSLGMARERVFLGYDVVDNAHFTEGTVQARACEHDIRAKHGLPRRYLLASARFIPKKNLPLLIAAYDRAIIGLEDPPDLVILGDGPERSAVEAAIRQTRCPGKIHLPGFRGYDLLPAFYGLSEGFVHVSTSEQWGLVVNEAAAAGLPILLSRPCGAAKHLVREGENGFLVDPYDIADITAKMRQLMTLPPEKRAAMGRASQRIVANWGPERFAEGLAEACRAALAQPPRRLAPWDALLLKALSRRRRRGIE